MVQSNTDKIDIDLTPALETEAAVRAIQVQKGNFKSDPFVSWDAERKKDQVKFETMGHDEDLRVVNAKPKTFFQLIAEVIDWLKSTLISKP